MKPLKDSRLSLRLPLALKERLARLEERTGIPPTLLAVEGLAAICAFYEANGVVTMPFAIVPTPGGRAVAGRFASAGGCASAGGAREKGDLFARAVALAFARPLDVIEPHPAPQAGCY